MLKLSGELFSDPDHNISFHQYDIVAQKLMEIVKDTGVSLAVVVGGGNIIRGREANSQVDHNEADTMGMLATVINGVGLREALLRHPEAETRLATAFDLTDFAERYIRHKTRAHLANGRIVIIAGGLGKPNFSTDSAVAQYADELNCEIILKASTVDGVYNSDPKTNPDAVKYAAITYEEALIQHLEIMDSTAFAICMRSRIPIFVFNIKDLDRIPEILRGERSFGTLITNTKA